MSRSGNALAVAGVRHFGHELRELEDLFDALGWSQVQVVAPEGSSVGPAVRCPVPLTRGFHLPKVPTVA